MEVLLEDFASGKHARVSLVRDAERELLVWKRPRDDSKAHQMSFRKEIQRASLWRDLGLSMVSVRWHEDNRSLLRTYVPGVTAADYVQDGAFWTAPTYTPERRALEEFFRHAAAQCVYVTDLNPRNMIFDGTRWQIVDSGSVRFRASPESTLKEYRRHFLARWSPHIPPAAHLAFENFVLALTLQGPEARLGAHSKQRLNTALGVGQRLVAVHYSALIVVLAAQRSC